MTDLAIDEVPKRDLCGRDKLLLMLQLLLNGEALVDGREYVMMMAMADLLLSTTLFCRLFFPAALADLLAGDALSLTHHRITHNRDPPPLVKAFLYMIWLCFV
ncbi:hypothetical protein Syun_006561 [Stephania yunnanensis]|uniref:Uncharacterized protein n=1 Tax=Stephania yunnanensis TaxID=152371 RepID=A0AAP0KXT8_9MAGN